MNVGMFPRKSSNVCILTAALVERNDAHSNKRFFEQRLSDTATGPGHQNCSICDCHFTLQRNTGRSRTAEARRPERSSPRLRYSRFSEALEADVPRGVVLADAASQLSGLITDVFEKTQYLQCFAAELFGVDLKSRPQDSCKEQRALS
jgi:hypothetical protein